MTKRERQTSLDLAQVLQRSAVAFSTMGFSVVELQEALGNLMRGMEQALANMPEEERRAFIQEHSVAEPAQDAEKPRRLPRRRIYLRNTNG